MRFLCAGKPRKVKLRGKRFYLGKGCIIDVSEKGKIVLGEKTWIERYSLFGACRGIIEIGKNNFFNTNCKLVALKSIKVGDNNLFGPNVVIVDHNHKYDEAYKLICEQGYEIKPVNIGSNVWIGANVTICAGVNICNDVVVAANSVVTKNIEKSGVYAGVPAKFLKELSQSAK